MLAVTASILTALNRQQTLELLYADLESVLDNLTQAVEVPKTGGVEILSEYAPRDQRFTTPLSGRYWIVAGLDGEAGVAGFLSSDSVWDWQIPWQRFPLADGAADPGQLKFADARGPDGEPVRIVLKTVRLPDAENPIALIAAADRRPTDRITRQFLITLLIALVILAIGLIIAVMVQVRISLRPLTRVQKDVADIRVGEKDKLDDDYPQEILPLTVELNKLLEHNRNVVERARTHVGNLAHALKTPIAVLMNEARENDDFSDLVRRQTRAMSDNVQHYLKRAQAAARAEVLGARTPIEPAINDLTRLMQKLSRDKGLIVEPGKVAPLVFRGERQDLDEMIGNLLENACKFAEREVIVTAEASGEDKLVIHIDDDGPGLTPEQRAEAMKRGVRLDETEPGTGLGLSIVKDLAELYSGRFELEDSPSKGLRATLILPRVAHT